MKPPAMIHGKSHRWRRMPRDDIARIVKIKQYIRRQLNVLLRVARNDGNIPQHKSHVGGEVAGAGPAG
jgi:hypothetical protein